jgi:hypothetical protein
MNEEHLRRVAAAIRGALAAAVEEYANGKRRAVPIVDRHFTAGNQQRYGWEPLSKDYFEQKAKGVVAAGQSGLVLDHVDSRRLKDIDRRIAFRKKVFKSSVKNNRVAQAEVASEGIKEDVIARKSLISKATKGRKFSKIDKSAQFNRLRGGLLVSSGANLPMLVRTGALRAAVNSGTHRIVASPDGNQVTVYFHNLPEYAVYLHDGTGKMPKRSPVQPNAEDYEQVYATARRNIDAVLKTVTTGPRAFNGAKARMV